MPLIQRGRRPVTSTTVAPASSTRASAARVRSEIVPSDRMIVPSRSVATRRGGWSTASSVRGGGAAMRYGVVILPTRRWAAARDVWRRVEQLGFHSAWTYDHLTWRD